MTVVANSSTWSQMLETNELQYQQAKIEKIFWFHSYSIANTQGARSLKKKQNKEVYGKCIAEYSFFKMRNLPSAL